MLWELGLLPVLLLPLRLLLQGLLRELSWLQVVLLLPLRLLRLRELSRLQVLLLRLCGCCCGSWVCCQCCCCCLCGCCCKGCCGN